MSFADREKLILKVLALAKTPAANLGSNFYNKLNEMSNRVGMSPDDILLVMTSESGLNPGALNPNGGASGLIQFMPSTLKSMKFQGTPEDLRNMSGEQQLDLVEKFIQGGMQANGGPFTSAAQFYISVFYPAALKLPGIRRGDSNAVFVEENPETIPNPKNPDELLSKKYYNVGYKIRAASESAAFKANKVFSRSVPGAITYGDMIKQVEQNKRNGSYQKASAELQKIRQQGPGEQMPQSKEEETSIEIDPEKHDYFGIHRSVPQHTQQEIDEDSQELMSLTTAGKLDNYLTIKISSKHFEDACEYANILSLALEEELNVKLNINTDNKIIEIECQSNDPLLSLAICDAMGHVEDLFKIATKKIGNIYIDTEVFVNKKSYLHPITVEAVEKNYKKFLLKFI